MATIDSRLDSNDGTDIETGDSVEVTLVKPDGSEIEMPAKVNGTQCDGTRLVLDQSGKTAGTVQLYDGFNGRVDEGNEINDSVIGHFEQGDQRAADVSAINEA